MKINNIYCVGRNYLLHALELGNPVPKSPLIFTKPSHAAVLMNGQQLVLPQEKGEVHYELEVVIKVSAAYVPGMQADDCIDAITLGLDLTLRDVQSELKAKGLPWLAAKGFKQSATLGEWLPYPGEEILKDKPFALFRNGSEVQRGLTREMLFSLSELVEHIGTLYGLAEGDLIYTGTPAGAGALQAGDKLEMYMEESCLGSCTI